MQNPPSASRPGAGFFCLGAPPFQKKKINPAMAGLVVPRRRRQTAKVRPGPQWLPATSSSKTLMNVLTASHHIPQLTAQPRPTTGPISGQKRSVGGCERSSRPKQHSAKVSLLCLTYGKAWGELIYIGSDVTTS